MSMFEPGPRRAGKTASPGRKKMPGKRYAPGTKGEPPNRVRTPQRKPMPMKVPQEGDTRTKKLLSNPPKYITEVYRNGQWVLQKEDGATNGRGRKPGKPRKGMDLNDAIRGMQRKQPWN